MTNVKVLKTFDRGVFHEQLSAHGKPMFNTQGEPIGRVEVINCQVGTEVEVPDNEVDELVKRGLAEVLGAKKSQDAVDEALDTNVANLQPILDRLDDDELSDLQSRETRKGALNLIEDEIEARKGGDDA